MSGQITVPCADGKVFTIPTVWSVGGLVVHRDIKASNSEAGFQMRRTWGVAHQSGYYLVTGLHSKERAIEVAERFLPLADWGQPREVLTACRSLKQDVFRLQKVVKW